MLFFDGNVSSTAVYDMEWRPVLGASRYEVSECGDVRNVFDRTTSRRKLHHGTIDPDGYLRHHLIYDDGKKYNTAAYRLVAEAFLGPPPTPLHEAAHNNGSKTSAYWRHLRWALPAENHVDRITHRTSSEGVNNGRAKIVEADVHYIRAEYRRARVERDWKAIHRLEARFDLHRATIISIAKGDTWAHIPFADQTLPGKMSAPAADDE